MGRISNSHTTAFACIELERSLDLFNCILLDNVADLHIVVTIDVKTAVHTHMNLLDVILEALE